MKKYFMGFLVGAIFTLSTTVFADEVKSLIGQKVQGTAAVSVNGSEIGTAVIINGTSYAPIRVVGEASGMEVAYDKGVVKLNEKESLVVSPSATPTRSSVKSNQEISDEINLNNNTVKITKEAIQQMQSSIDSGNYSGEELQYIKDHLETAKKRLTSSEQKIIDLQSQLAELQP